MNLLALALAILAGVLTAFVVCRAIKARLVFEVLAGVSAISAIKIADTIGGGAEWPFAGGLLGYLGVVLYLRWRKRHVQAE